VGETQAALLARAALAHATDREARAALSQIAEDEARHAELAHRFVAFALRSDRSLAGELRSVLAEALAQLPQPTAADESPEIAAALHAAGRLTPGERAGLSRTALLEIVVPCTEALLGPSCPARSLDSATC
jgi:hypothetical protein